MLNSETSPLGELADLTVGHVGSMADQYVETGIPFLRSKNVKPFRLDLADVKYVPAAFHQRLRKSALRPGDVVVVRTGTPGAAAVIPDSLPECNCADLVVIRPGPDLDPNYLAYFINGVASGYVSSRLVGAVQQHFNIGAARELQVPQVPIREQRAIAGVLGAIDDAVNVELGIVTRSRELARSLLIQDASGSHFVLSEVADVVRGCSYKSSDLGAPDGQPLVSMGSAERRGWLKRSAVRQFSGRFGLRHVASPGDLLLVNVDLTWRLDVLGWPLLVPGDLGPVIFSNDIYKVAFREPNLELRLSVWAQLMSPSTRAVIEGCAKGTTVASIAAQDLLDLDFRRPMNEAVANAAWLLLERAWAAEIAVARLTDTRDALLAPLLTGNVRVGDAEAIAEELS